MSLILQGSTSGSVTLQEPAVAGTTVLTLPAVSGTVLTTTSPKAGNVIQVVQGLTGAPVTTSTSALITSGLSATITPTSASSKILVMISLQGVGKGTNSTSLALWLHKNGSPLSNFAVNNTAFTGTGADNFPGTSAFNYLDSPATTSPTTYEVFFGSASNVATVYLQVNGSTPTITLLEIAA